jgi:hypothetical protein
MQIWNWLLIFIIIFVWILFHFVHVLYFCLYFVLLYFFVWPVCSLILIAPLVSSNTSYIVAVSLIGGGNWKKHRPLPLVLIDTGCCNPTTKRSRLIIIFVWILFHFVHVLYFCLFYFCLFLVSRIMIGSWSDNKTNNDMLALLYTSN